MQLDAVLAVERGQAIQILVIADPVLDRELLDIRGRVGDAGPEIPGVAAGKGDFAGELRHRRAGQHNRGLVDRGDELTRAVDPVIDDRIAVEHRTAGALRFLDSLLRELPLLVAGVAVGGGRHDVGEPFAIERHHQRPLHFEGREAAARLRQAAALGDRTAHHPAELLVPRKLALQVDGGVEIDRGA